MMRTQKVYHRLQNLMVRFKNFITKHTVDEFNIERTLYTINVANKPVSKRYALLELYRYTENERYHQILLSIPNFIDTIRKQLLSSDTSTQIICCKCLNNLAYDDSCLRLLSKQGIPKTLIMLIGKFTEMEIGIRAGFSPANAALRESTKAAREILKLLTAYCKMPENRKMLVRGKGLEYIVKALKYELLKVQKTALKCVLTIVQNEPGDSDVQFQLVKKGIIGPLYNLLKHDQISVQKDALRIYMHLSKCEKCQDEIFRSGAFHSILCLFRTSDIELQQLAIETVANFIQDNENFRIDALVLKYGLDALINAFINERTPPDMLAATIKCLAHLSEYKRIHAVLLHKPVLRQVFRLTLNNMNDIHSMTFSALLIISNMTKYKEGQIELFQQGGLDIILASLKAITYNQLNRREAIRDSGIDYDLLSKVITRTVANMSAACPECQIKIIVYGMLDPLVKLIMTSKERTVKWNGLCAIVNLCEVPQNQPKIISKDNVQDCLYHFLIEQDDLRLQSRALRCITILSRNPKLHSLLIDLFGVKPVIDLASTVHKNEILLDSLKYIVNLLQNEEFHPKIISAGAIPVIVRLSFLPIPVFQTEVARGLYHLAQNAKSRAELIKDGAITRVLAMKESNCEKVRKYCVNALRKF